MVTTALLYHFLTTSFKVRYNTVQRVKMQKPNKLNRMINWILSELASKDKNKEKILKLQYKKNHFWLYNFIKNGASHILLKFVI